MTTATAYESFLDWARDVLTDHGLEGAPLVAAALKGHDPTTSVHLEAIGPLAEALALEMGFTPEMATDVGLSATVHDIGKIGVSSQLLRSDKPLTEDERQTLRQHPRWGWSFLSTIRGAETAAAVARWHHERWDGLGYPDGLAGSEIPEEVTIVSVADALDAMVSNRPYSPARPVTDAVREISDCAGGQFCPRAVKALQEMHRRGALQPLIASRDGPDSDAPAPPCDARPRDELAGESDEPGPDSEEETSEPGDEWLAPNRQTQHELVLSCVALVWQIARSVWRGGSAGISLEDLVAEGHLALVKAAGRFDERKGVKFSSFAGYAIHGAIRDAMRRSGLGPRGIYKLIRQYESAADQLGLTLGRSPSSAEMSTTLNLDARSVDEVKWAQSLRLVGLDRLPFELRDDGDNDPEELTIRRVDAAAAASLLYQLPERDQTVLIGRYFRGQTQKQVGAALGLSESRICQLEHRALITLRGMIERLERRAA